MLRENDSLKSANEKLHIEKEKLLKSKDLADNQIGGLIKSLEALQKDVKEREHQVTMSSTNAFSSRICNVMKSQ